MLNGGLNNHTMSNMVLGGGKNSTWAILCPEAAVEKLLYGSSQWLTLGENSPIGNGYVENWQFREEYGRALLAAWGKHAVMSPHDVWGKITCTNCTMACVVGTKVTCTNCNVVSDTKQLSCLHPWSGSGK